MSEQAMRRTQEEFAKTAERVDSVERLVREGRSRQSIERGNLTSHSNPNQLQKLVPDPYRDNDGNSTFGIANSHLGNDKDGRISNDATSKPGNNSIPPLPPALLRMPTKVPDSIRKEMVELGFRPSSKNQDAFDYDSDTIE